MAKVQMKNPGSTRTKAGKIIRWKRGDLVEKSLVAHIGDTRFGKPGDYPPDDEKKAPAEIEDEEKAAEDKKAAEDGKK